MFFLPSEEPSNSSLVLHCEGVQACHTVSVDLQEAPVDITCSGDGCCKGLGVHAAERVRVECRGGMVHGCNGLIIVEATHAEVVAVTDAVDASEMIVSAEFANLTLGAYPGVLKVDATGARVTGNNGTHVRAAGYTTVSGSTIQCPDPFGDGNYVCFLCARAVVVRCR